jgi:hypothetical protein
MQDAYDFPQLTVVQVNACSIDLSGVLPEEGSPPPSSTPDIEFHKAAQVA